MIKRLPEYCIWDFNGTILDDVMTGIASVNCLLGQRGLPLLESIEQYRAVFRFPIQGYYERLGFDFSKEPYEVIAPLWVAEYLKRVPSAPVQPGVKELLEHFRALGVKQVILSATELGMLNKQLSELGMVPYFEEILGLDNIHASSKLSLAEEWRARHPDATAILLGDTDHDAETARRMNADCYLIARGHQSAAYLCTVGVPVYEDLEQFYSENFGSMS